jgi:putative membrane protein
MIRATLALGLLGLAAATALVIWYGAVDVGRLLAADGLGIVGASLFHFVPMAVNARAWQILVPGRGRPSVLVFTWLVWVREAVNGLLPVARVGGEVATIRLMRDHGITTPVAVASTVVDMTVSIASQFLFTVLGLALVLAVVPDAPLVWRLVLGLLVAVPLVAVLFAVQKVGLFQLFRRLFLALSRGRWASFLDGAARVDRRIALMWRRRRAVLACLFWQFLGWVLGSGEIWLALHAIGHPVSLGEALMIEALAQAVSSAAFVVPGALGVQEGGFLLFGALVGLSPEAALALALARRARDLIVFVPALVIWQVGLGRSLAGGARAASGAE